MFSSRRPSLHHSFLNLLLSVILFLSHSTVQTHCGTILKRIEAVSIAAHKPNYDITRNQVELNHKNPSQFFFQRFKSPVSIKDALKFCRDSSSFKWYHGKDGRKGRVLTTKLHGDWVLAESEQIVVGCTTEDILRAYFSSKLQKKWNRRDVLDCTFSCKSLPTIGDKIDQNALGGPKFAPSPEMKYYVQHLTLHPKRIILSSTGIMKYSQTLTIDKIGNNNYSVMVRLDPNQQNPTVKRPFQCLSVYISLEQKLKNVHIYAAGVMQVNRKVVPNFGLFDARGYAGSVAGKATLWLVPHFKQCRKIQIHHED